MWGQRWLYTKWHLPVQVLRSGDIGASHFVAEVELHASIRQVGPCMSEYGECCKFITWRLVYIMLEQSLYKWSSYWLVEHLTKCPGIYSRASIQQSTSTNCIEQIISDIARNGLGWEGVSYWIINDINTTHLDGRAKLHMY